MALHGIPTRETITLTAVEMPPFQGIVDTDIPATYTPGHNFDVRVKFRVDVLGWHQDNTKVVWQFDGANLDEVDVYKWTGASDPDFSAAVPDDLSGTDWVLLARPPINELNSDGEWFDAAGNWLGDVAQFFLLRFGAIPTGTQGLFSMRANLQEGTDRIYSAFDPV